MRAVGERPLETGWLPDTPVGDTVLRRFVHSQGEVNAVTATALGGRSDHTDDVFLADSGLPVAYFNQALLARPLVGPDDPVLDVVDGFFGDRTSITLLSIWPTPDLAGRGWAPVGHPALVLRAPGPYTHAPGDGVTVRVADSADDLAAAQRVVVEGYPIEQARDVPPGDLFPSSLADAGLVVRLGLLDDAPAAIGNCLVAHGIVNLCLGATLPNARRRGVWEALVWARVAEAPELPAVAFTSDHSRPGFLRMGFLPLTRLTLWAR